MKIGHTQELAVLERNRDSIILADEQGQTALLPASEAGTAAPGDVLRVFVFTDPQGSPLATTRTPLVEKDQCASLKVVDITHAGAFLDWGLPKNLLLPFAEQRRPLEIGRYETVLVYQDNSGRLAASSRLDHHLPDSVDDLRPWQPVSLLICQRTELGLKAIVDNRALGLLYSDEIFQSVRVGETHRGYVKRLRSDGRIDLSLQPRSRELQPDLASAIIDYLRNNEGVLKLGDKSSPEAIQVLFKVSKKNFKKALSSLYRERRIAVYPEHVELITSDGTASNTSSGSAGGGSAKGTSSSNTGGSAGDSGTGCT